MIKHLSPLKKHAVSSQNGKNNGDRPLGELPEWNLDDLYESPDSDKLKSDLADARKKSESLAHAYEGQITDLDGKSLASAVRKYEKIHQILGRIDTYAFLRFVQNGQDTMRAKFLGDMRTQITDISRSLVFFTLEINQIDEKDLEACFAQSKTLARYRPWFSQLRALKPHQLSDELERFIHDQSAIGARAWNRLFDETMSGLRFSVEDKTLGLEQTLSYLTEADADKRKKAAKALEKVFAENIRLFTLITNTLAHDKEIEDRWRKFPTPQSARHLQNQIEPKIVDALHDAVISSYQDISHRYYALKARKLGVDKLPYWDRNAPWPEKDQRTISWNEATEIVLASFDGFSPRLSELARPFFDRRWIDASTNEGKSPGAFAHPGTTDTHPFIMLNYMGKTRDVITLAHELGHGIHQRLAAQHGELLAPTPLTLAETASVFGEMLTFQAMLANAPELPQQRSLLAGKIEDMINTMFRQISFYEFECRIHNERRQGELTAEQIGDIWLDTQSACLGEAIEIGEDYRNYWCYVPHFIHSPFYVYSYAFGDGLVNVIYDIYREGNSDFENKFFSFLSAGGCKKLPELLEQFSLDATDPSFWQRGLNIITGMIDRLETLIQQEA